MHFRFSGHESFPCRYTWLPKAFKGIIANPLIFSDDNVAMVKLGLGKNMVKSVRFWVQAFGIAAVNEEGQGMVPTHFGNSLLNENGLDPFLEDIKTLWLLHWKISSNADPLFAWYFLMNQWPEPAFSRSEIVKAFTQESDKMERPLSDFTKEQHFDIFLRTYLSSRSKNDNEVLEDSLDSPLTELNLILPAGERVINDSSKREPVYEFRQDSKNEVTGELFAYCIFDYWRKNRQVESTVSFRDVASSSGSVGQIFKLSEMNIRSRLESLHHDSKGMFEYVASAATPRIVKSCELNDRTQAQLLKRIYEQSRSNRN